MIRIGDLVKVKKTVSFPKFPEGTVGMVEAIVGGMYRIRANCADGYGISWKCFYSEDELEPLYSF